MRRTYRGSCHCGAVRFEVDADIDHVRVCDCSVCAKRGALNFRVPPTDFRLLTPLADLACYEWATFTAKDYFCRTCGILPFRIPRAPSDEERAQGLTATATWAVNVRCLAGIDISSIPAKYVQGSKLPLP